MRVSNSKIKTYRRCPKKYEFKYVMGLRPKKKKLELERGTWIHDLLMHHYDGEDWKERHRELSRAFKNLFEEEREELGDLPRECARIMLSYLRTYHVEDSQYRTVDTELDELVTLPNGLELQVVVDRIAEDTRGGLWVWDHKTRGTFETSDNMVLDPQLTLYYWGLEQMGYRPLRGGVYNEIRTKAPAVPALLKSGGLSKRRNIDTDVFTYMSEIRRQGLDPAQYADILRLIAARQHERFFRRTAIPKDPPVIRTMLHELVRSAQQIQDDEAKDQFPRTFDHSCKWQCEYKDLCITQLHGGDISSLIKHGFTVKPRKEEDEVKTRVKV